MSILMIMLGALMLATLAVLVVGVLLMGKGGEANRKYANKLMTARVILQASVLLLLLLLFALGGRG